MMIVKNYVAPSTIHGVGLFAGERIAENQRIYVFAQEVDVAMTRQEIALLGDEFLRFMVICAYEDLEDHRLVISIDNSRFMNHSDRPNTRWDAHTGWATQTIEVGEELTCDYHTFWYRAPFADPRR